MKKLIIFCVLGLGIGCKEQEIKSMFDEMAKQKQDVQNELGQFSVNEKSLQVIQPFFENSFVLITDLLNQTDPKQTLTSVMKAIGPDQFCEKTVLAKQDWEKIDSQCRSQASYLCSEEVKGLPSLYKRLFSEAPNEIKMKLNKNSVCKDWNS